MIPIFLQFSKFWPRLGGKGLMITVYFPTLHCLLMPVYMEASYPGKRAGSVAKTNYFLCLFGPFHPVSQDEV